MESCGCHKWKWLIFGIVLVLVRLLMPAWYIWVVIGVLAIIKGLLKIFKVTTNYQLIKTATNN